MHNINTPNLVSSLEWYTTKLGFNKLNENSVKRGDIEIEFSVKDSVEKAEYRFQVSDIEEVFEEFVVSGIATIERPPLVTFFGTKELNISDPNGHKLIFFEEIE